MSKNIVNSCQPQRRLHKFLANLSHTVGQPPPWWLLMAQGREKLGKTVLCSVVRKYYYPNGQWCGDAEAMCSHFSLFAQFTNDAVESDVWATLSAIRNGFATLFGAGRQVSARYIPTRTNPGAGCMLQCNLYGSQHFPAKHRNLIRSFLHVAFMLIAK